MHYRLAAIGLNLFSMNRWTKMAYRAIGTAKNNRRSRTETIEEDYIVRAKSFLDILRQHNILHDGMDLMELGTGWVHWESMVLRNEIVGQTLLYDVWDNRSHGRFQAYARQMADRDIRHRIGLSKPDNAELMREISNLASMEAVYDRLGFSYCVDGQGLLADVPEESRDLIYSSGVAEHFLRDDAQNIIQRTYEILRPGGWAFHQIVLEDHLTIYSSKTHKKNYLRYAPAHFEFWLNNDVQYINRLQIPDWSSFFEKAGFETVMMDRIVSVSLDEFPVHAAYQDISGEDLACTVVQYLVRKPV